MLTFGRLNLVSFLTICESFLQFILWGFLCFVSMLLLSFFSYYTFQPTNAVLVQSMNLRPPWTRHHHSRHPHPNCPIAITGSRGERSDNSSASRSLNFYGDKRHITINEALRLERCQVEQLLTRHKIPYITQLWLLSFACLELTQGRLQFLVIPRRGC